MPIINIKFIENVVATQEQKEELILKMTETFAGVLGDVVRPFTYVVIDETPQRAWGIAGQPMPDLAWLCGPEYQGYHAKARDVMNAFLESTAAAAPASGNGNGSTAPAQASATAANGQAGSVEVTPELVGKAYAALGSMDMGQIRQYWDEGMHWLVPGHNQLSGWYNGRDQFLDFMKKVGELSGGSFKMEPISIMTGPDYSADVTHNLGHRAEDDKKILDINVVHVLHWRNGRVVEGRGAIFGDGTEKYDEFWAPVTASGTRLKA